MTITLRQESATGATTKGSALTYSELDNNFVHLLRQGSVSVGADSGTQQTLGEADRDSLLNITGGTDISTTVSAPDSAGATTVEIAFTGSAGIANVVEDTTPQLGGDLDAQSNNITSLGTLNTHTIPGGTGTFALTSDITFTDVVDDTTPQLGGDLDGQGNEITDVELDNYKEVIYTGGSTTGTITPDVANGNVQKISLTGSITFNAFANAEAGQSMTLIIDTNGTSRTLTSTMLFAGGTKTLSTTDTIDIMTVFYDGTTYYASLSTNFS